MIKLSNILKELKSTKNLDKVDRTKPYTILWDNGAITAMVADEQPTLTLSKIIPMKIDEKKKSISITDWDDWSSFKDILRMQQAVKDVTRAQIADENWKIDITLTDVGKNIGSYKVSDFLDYDATFTKTIPIAFHGTTDKELDSIQSLGIVPPSTTDRELLKWDKFYGPDSQDKTYWSIDYNRAAYYARNAANLYKKKRKKANPIVIEIHDWPISNVTADDDFQSNMSMIQLVAAMQKGKKIDTTSPIQSIRSTAQFAIKGRVPANKIVKIHKV